MRVLFTAPPEKSTYTNLCYRFVEIGEVAGYLRNAGHKVTVFDGLMLDEKTWIRDLSNSLVQNDILVFYHSGDSGSAVIKYAQTIKEYNPDIICITYGIVSNYSPNAFLESEAFDAIVIAGDWEAVLLKLVEYFEDGCLSPLPNGSVIRTNGKWIRQRGEYRLLADDWAFPALDLLPLEDYRTKYNDSGSIAGKKGSFELSLSVSRGCPYGCWFCPSLKVDGRAERRRSLQSVLGFLRNSVQYYGFNQLALFSACFTLNRHWVLDFCGEISKDGPTIPWRCVTTLQDMDEELLNAMSSAGCWRIGIGIETLNPSILRKLNKEIEKQKLETIISSCQKNDIHPMCFLLDGLPGQTTGEVQNDAEILKSMGATVRISKLVNYAASSKYKQKDISSHLAREVEFIHPEKIE